MGLGLAGRLSCICSLAIEIFDSSFLGLSRSELSLTETSGSALIFGLLGGPLEKKMLHSHDPS
jgi:hypothetical protein